MQELTERQKEVLSYIKGYINRNGYSPARAEIARHFDMNPNAAQGHIVALRRKMAITFKDGVSRSILVV